LSIMACVRQTCVVVVVPLKGDFMPAGKVTPGGKGDCCQVMLLVISHRPGFLVDCAQANRAKAKRQQPIVIQSRVLCIKPPWGSRRLLAARAFTLAQRTICGKEKSQARLARASRPRASSASATPSEAWRTRLPSLAKLPVMTCTPSPSMRSMSATIGSAPWAA